MSLRLYFPPCRTSPGIGNITSRSHPGRGDPFPAERRGQQVLPHRATPPAHPASPPKPRQTLRRPPHRGAHPRVLGLRWPGRGGGDDQGVCLSPPPLAGCPRGIWKALEGIWGDDRHATTPRRANRCCSLIAVSAPHWPFYQLVSITNALGFVISVGHQLPQPLGIAGCCEQTWKSQCWLKPGPRHGSIDFP